VPFRTAEVSIMWLFASYSRKDETAVRELMSDLRRAHLSVWHDQELRGGDPWWQDILLRIRECDVFLFLLSHNSLASKPCLAELSYARALGLPILPVQVGPAGNLRLTPVADIQVVDYREQTLAKGMELLDAIQQAVTERQPLPEPLPEPPPVPFEYLLRLGSAIGAAQLTPDQQGDFIRQLRDCLETEDDEGVRDDARELLRALRRRPDITYRNAQAIDQLLAELAAAPTRGPDDGPDDGDTARLEGTPAHPTGARGRDPGAGTPTADEDAGQGYPRRRRAGSHAAGRRRERSLLTPRLLVSAVVLLALVALTTGVVLFLSADATAVRAEAAQEPAEYPFTPPVVPTESGQEPEAPAEGTMSGGTPGLYGGTGTNNCDADAVARHLVGDQRKAVAWATAQRIGTHHIHGFLESLTGVTLRTDTAVTNHDYRDGQAVPFLSVLQAGSTVLVDERGVPRVRCACGNPLLRAELPPGARYEGATWPEFSPENVTVVTPAPESVDTFVLLDRDVDEVVARPRGTEGERDAPADPADAATARAFGQQDAAPPPDDGTDDQPRGGADEESGSDPTPAPGDESGDGTEDESEGPLDDGSDIAGEGNDDPGTVPGGEGSEGTDDGTGDGSGPQPGGTSGETGDGTVPRNLPPDGSGTLPDGGTDMEDVTPPDDGSGDALNGTDTEEATPPDAGAEDEAGNGDGTGLPPDGTGNGTVDGDGDGTGLPPDGSGNGTDDGAGAGTEDGSGDVTDNGTGAGTSSSTVPDAGTTD
jgi:hypothetical protein